MVDEAYESAKSWRARNESATDLSTSPNNIASRAISAALLQRPPSSAQLGTLSRPNHETSDLALEKREAVFLADYDRITLRFAKTSTIAVGVCLLLAAVVPVDGVRFLVGRCGVGA